MPRMPCTPFCWPTVTSAVKGSPRACRSLPGSAPTVSLSASASRLSPKSQKLIQPPQMTCPHAALDQGMTDRVSSLISVSGTTLKCILHCSSEVSIDLSKHVAQGKPTQELGTVCSLSLHFLCSLACASSDQPPNELLALKSLSQIWLFRKPKFGL